MKRIILFIIFEMVQIKTICQENQKYFGSEFHVGFGFGYKWDIENPYIGNTEGFHEIPMNVSAIMRLSKRFWIGVHSNPILTLETFYVGDNRFKTYAFNGILGQIDVANQNGVRLFMESSLNLGNYCSCDTSLYVERPFERKGLFYTGLVGGISYVFNQKKENNLILQLSFGNYFILNSEWNNDFYIQYLLGLKYRFGQLN